MELSAAEQSARDGDNAAKGISLLYLVVIVLVVAGKAFTPAPAPLLTPEQAMEAAETQNGHISEEMLFEQTTPDPILVPDLDPSVF